MLKIISFYSIIIHRALHIRIPEDFLSALAAKSGITIIDSFTERRVILYKYRYYYDHFHLNDQRAVYVQIEQAIRQLKFSVILIVNSWLGSTDPGEAIRMILESVYADNPELFYVETSRCTTLRLPLMRIRVTFSYRVMNQQCAQCILQLNEATKQIISSLFPNGWEQVSQIRREKILFDYIVAHTVYYNEAVQKNENGELKTSLPIAWTTYGALVNHRAVCHGIAAAFKLLCDQVALPCILVIGQAGGRHAWNIVSIQENFYHVDCTWDLHSSINREIPYMRYRYMNLPDRVMLAERTVECDFLPACGSLRFNPFMIRGMCLRDPAVFVDQAAAQVRFGRRRFAFLMDCDRKLLPSPQSLANALSSSTGRNTTIYVDGCFIGVVMH